MTASRVRASVSPARVGAGILISSIVALVTRDYPWVGHDYRYFIPRLIDTDLHLRHNGPTIQWYTPTFGGGLPAFPNPQHLEYSLVQGLTLMVDPWMAVLLSTAVVALVGYWALYQVARTALGIGPSAAALSAMFFVGNGFFIEHLIVGHLGFQLFPLGAVMLWALVDRRRPAIANGALLALSVTLMLHQAGFYLVILLGLSVALAVPMLAILRDGLLDWRRVGGTVAVALGLTAGMAGSKIYAVLQLMRQFPREAADTYSIGPLTAAAGLVAQLVGSMTLVPLFALVGVDPARVSGALMQLTGADVRSGIWEVDTGLSPVLIGILVLGVVHSSRRIHSQGWPAWRPAQVWPLLVVMFVTWVAVESILARGVIYPLLKQLPLIGSLHVNHRLAGAFVLPLALVGGVLVDRWAHRRAAYAWMLVGLTALAPLSYFMLPSHVHLRTFNLSSSLDVARRARLGERFDVARIVDDDDAAALSDHGSSLRPYEPLFGYANESFRPQVQIGEVREARSGYFNMTHAASLVFPEANNVRPFDRIAATDRDELEAFVSRRQPHWKVPTIEVWLNRAAVLSVVMSGVLVLIGLRRRDASDRR